MIARYLNSGGGGLQSLVHSPWRLTLALAALIAVAALAVFSLDTPVEAGENPEGQPLFGKCESLKCVDVPVPDGTAERVRGLKAVQISAGSDHAYALTAKGALIGWGFPGNGRLNTPELKVYPGNNGEGDGTRGLTNQEPIKWKQVAAGNLHTCAVTTEGEVYCWGDNSYGQTDIPAGLLSARSNSGMPNPRFLKIVTGGNHTCVLEDETSQAIEGRQIRAGSIVCWGDDTYGQTGSQDPLFGDANPANDDPLPDDDSAGLGGRTADTNGDLGDPDTVGAERVDGEGDPILYVDVTTGTNHTCAVRTTGIVDCWGDDSQGQATVPLRLRTPQHAEIVNGQLEPSGRFHSIEAGDNFTCAINRDGGALCWGSNSHAQEYPPVGEYTQLSAGRWHACALWTFDDDPQRPTTAYGGNVDCWGDNSGRKATPPPTVERRTVSGKTVLLSKLSWTQVSAGGTFSCGIFDPERSTAPELAANQAIFASATDKLEEEGIVECWGIGPAATVPVQDTVARVAKYKLEQQCDFSDDHNEYDVRPTDGWGRIYGLPTEDGAIRFGFKVVQAGPDIWINPQFRFVPSNGNLTVNRWYYSEPMTVWDAVAPGEGISMAGQNCDCGSERVVGRIAVRLLESGRMQLALMTPDGRVMANVPADHDQIPNPAETNKWWATGFIKWYDAP